MAALNTQRRLAFDQASKQRMAWAQHALRDTLRLTVADVYQHAVVRRALEAYCVHLEGLLNKAPGKDRDITHWAERGRLKVARNGADIWYPRTHSFRYPSGPFQQSSRRPQRVDPNQPPPCSP